MNIYLFLYEIIALLTFIISYKMVMNANDVPEGIDVNGPMVFFSILLISIFWPIYYFVLFFLYKNDEEI